MTTIYRKTARGQSEIETRAHHLTPRYRTPLIMVDGRRTDEELRKLIAGQPDEILHALLEQGFIEVAESPPPRAASSSEARRTTSPIPLSSKPPSSVPSDGRPVRLEEVRRMAVRSLTDQLGPAAEGIALKIERAKTVDELRLLLVAARDILRNASGADVAAAFSARFIGAPE